MSILTIMREASDIANHEHSGRIIDKGNRQLGDVGEQFIKSTGDIPNVIVLGENPLHKHIAMRLAQVFHSRGRGAFPRLAMESGLAGDDPLNAVKKAFGDQRSVLVVTDLDGMEKMLGDTFRKVTHRSWPMEAEAFVMRDNNHGIGEIEPHLAESTSLVPRTANLKMPKAKTPDWIAALEAQHAAAHKNALDPGRNCKL